MAIHDNKNSIGFPNCALFGESPSESETETATEGLGLVVTVKTPFVDCLGSSGSYAKFVCPLL